MRLGICCMMMLVAVGAAGAGEPITDFTFPWADKPAPPTAVEAYTMDEQLHFVFTVEDRDIVYNETWNGENTLDGEDRVEVFFAKDAALKAYWCIEVDSAGRVHDYKASHYRKFDNTWNCPGLKTKAERTPAGYTVTMSVPLATLSDLLGMPVKEGAKLRLGFFRAEFYGTDPATHGDANDNWLSWVRPETEKPDFHVPSAFRLWAVPGAKPLSQRGGLIGESDTTRE